MEPTNFTSRQNHTVKQTLRYTSLGDRPVQVRLGVLTDVAIKKIYVPGYGAVWYGGILPTY